MLYLLIQLTHFIQLNSNQQSINFSNFETYFQIDTFKLMKRNSSQPQFKGLTAMSMTLQSPSTNTQKKIQGFDLTSTIKTTNFTSKIQQLKNKPNKQSIEDQYIKGLQDQIHYLQMQLKLLQQKDQAKHGQIDQLQKFFSDGVPINENILAIKNGFNNYKKDKQKTIKQLMNEKKQRQTLIDGLGKRIQQMQKQLQKDEKDIRGYQSNSASQLHALIKTQAKLRKQIQLEDQQLKIYKFQNRKLSQKLTTLQRNKQIQMVMTLKSDNHKMDKLSKIKQTITEKQAEYEDLDKQHEELLKQEEEKSYVIKIEQENLNLKKKAIAMERELNALQTKAQEKQMELDSKLKDRYRQISAKTQMKIRLQSQKARINKQNSMKVQDIQKLAKQKQISLLQKIIDQNKKLSKYTEYYGELLSKVQDSIQNMVEKKPQLKNQINAYGSEVKRLTEMIQQERVRMTELCAQIAQDQAKIEHLQSVTPPLMDTIQRTGDQIRMYKSQREKLSEDIKVKQKQLELILILRSLSLQQVQMSKSSSSNIQDKLIGFIRDWEQLQRN